MKRRKIKSGYSVVVTLESGEVQVGEPFPTEAQAKSYRKYLRRGRGRWSSVRSIKILKSNGRRKTRCWKGYEPVKGMRPYSKGSCRKVRRNPMSPRRQGHLGFAFNARDEEAHKTKARPIPGMFYRVYFSHPERGETTALIFKGEQLRKLSVSDLSRYWPLKEGLKMAKVHFSGPFESWDMAFLNR